MYIIPHKYARTLVFIVKLFALKFNIMAKDRNVQILEHKIAELDKKIANFEKFHIDKKKTENLRILKLKYETDLEEIMAQ